MLWGYRNFECEGRRTNHSSALGILMAMKSCTTITHTNPNSAKLSRFKKVGVSIMGWNVDSPVQACSGWPRCAALPPICHKVGGQADAGIWTLAHGRFLNKPLSRSWRSLSQAGDQATGTAGNAPGRRIRAPPVFDPWAKGAC